MAVNSINSSSIYQTQSTVNWQQIKQDLKSLDSALKSGDLASAKDAFSKLSQNRNIDSDSPLGKIGEALQKGDVTSALQVINPTNTNSNSRPSTLAWQQLTKLISGSQGAATNSASVNNNVSNLFNFLSSGSTGSSTNSTSSSSISGIINEVLSEFNNSNGSSTTVSLGASDSTDSSGTYTAQGLAQQIKNNPQLGALLAERLKNQSSSTLFDSL